MLGVGDCLLIETNIDIDGETQQLHLHIILLEPEEYTGNTIIVVINTYRGDKHDSTTLIQPDEYEFIVRKSYVNYRLARIISLIELQGLIDKGIAKVKTPVSQELLQRINVGIKKSPFTKEEVRIMYTNSLFN